MGCTSWTQPKSDPIWAALLRTWAVLWPVFLPYFSKVALSLHPLGPTSEKGWNFLQTSWIGSKLKAHKTSQAHEQLFYNQCHNIVHISQYPQILLSKSTRKFFVRMEKSGTTTKTIFIYFSIFIFENLGHFFLKYPNNLENPKILFETIISSWRKTLVHDTASLYYVSVHKMAIKASIKNW